YAGANGGAIYTASDVILNINPTSTLVNDDGSITKYGIVEFSGNGPNGIYVNNADATFTFNFNGLGYLFLEDIITGVEGYNVVFNSENKDNTCIYVEQIQNADVFATNVKFNRFWDESFVTSNVTLTNSDLYSDTYNKEDADPRDYYSYMFKSLTSDVNSTAYIKVTINDLMVGDYFADTLTVGSGSSGVLTIDPSLFHQGENGAPLYDFINDADLRATVLENDISIVMQLLYKEDTNDSLQLALKEGLAQRYEYDVTYYNYSVKDTDLLGSVGIDLNEEKDSLVFGILTRKNNLQYMNQLSYANNTRTYTISAPTTIKEGAIAGSTTQGLGVTGAGTLRVVGNKDDVENYIIDLSDADGNYLTGFEVTGDKADLVIEGVTIKNSSNAIILNQKDSSVLLDSVVFINDNPGEDIAFENISGSSFVANNVYVSSKAINRANMSIGGLSNLAVLQNIGGRLTLADDVTIEVLENEMSSKVDALSNMNLAINVLSNKGTITVGSSSMKDSSVYIQDLENDAGVITIYGNTLFDCDGIRNTGTISLYNNTTFNRGDYDYVISGEGNLNLYDQVTSSAIINDEQKVTLAEHSVLTMEDYSYLNLSTGDIFHATSKIVLQDGSTLGYNLYSNGSIEANAGKLIFESGTFAFADSSIIQEEATVDLVGTTLDVSGGTINLNAGDTWTTSTVNLAGGTLNYGLVDNGTIIANGGNLNILEGAELFVNDGSWIDQGSVVNLAGTLNVSGGPVTLGANDTWDGSVVVSTGRFGYFGDADNKLGIRGSMLQVLESENVPLVYLENAVLELLDTNFTTTYLGNLRANNGLDVKLDINDTQADIIKVASGSSGIITITELSIDEKPESPEVKEILVLQRENADDDIKLELSAELLGNLYTEASITDYLINGEYVIKSTDFIGKKGVMLNETKDSILLGGLSIGKNLYETNIFESGTTPRRYVFDAPAETTLVIQENEDYNTTASGTFYVEGHGKEYAIIDLMDSETGIKHAGFALKKANTTIHLSNLTIQNATNALYLVGDTSTAFIDNVIFRNNKSATFGGAIYLQNSSSIESINAEFYNNISTNYGGAITLSSNSTVSIGTISGLFEANSSANGGAIAVLVNTSTTGTIDSINADFVGNYATTYGGAILNKTGTIKNISGKFEQNYAGNYGGAIYNYDSRSIIENISADFIGNYASGEGANLRGGAIYNVGHIANINGNFTGNWSDYEGGAIFTLPSSIIDNITASFTGNYSVNSSGGAIFNFGTITKIAGSTFTDNNSIAGAVYNGSTITEITDTIFTGNYAGADGGAIYNVLYSGSSAGTIETISNSTFTGNYAGNNGGAIYNASTGVIETINSTFTGNYSGNYGGAIANRGIITEIIGSAFVGNYTQGIISTGTLTPHGGAIHNNGTITKIASSTFTDNYAKGVGGAIFNRGTISEIIDSSFTGNYATTSGGAIWNQSTISAITGSTFTGNYSGTYGGAIVLSSNSTVSIGAVSGLFEANSSDKGGAIALIVNTSTSTSTIDSITADFEGNYATTGGGAIYNCGTIIEIANSTFTGNYADNYGGAIYNYSARSIIENISADFEGNYSAYGGAIYNAGHIANINGNFIGNYAGNDGGAIVALSSSIIDNITASFTGNYSVNSVAGAICNVGTITKIAGSTFTDNYAVNSGAGAVYNASTITEITGSTFSGNYATGSGGAILNSASGVIESITNTRFMGNYSTNYGGAIEANDGSTIGSILGSHFENNYSGYGGALSTGASINNLSATFTGNYANSGGAISNAGTITNLDGVFAKNYSNVSGGAIFNVSVGNITYMGGQFDQNYSLKDGGAIYNTGMISEITGSTFTGNYAVNNGGAIYNTGTIRLFRTVDFIGNYAGNYGGAIYTTQPLAFVNTNFLDNYVSPTSGNAYGGAIYTTADLYFTADASAPSSRPDHQIIISGNYLVGPVDDLAIYVANRDATINFEAVNGGSIIIDDYIMGDSGYNVIFTGDMDSHIYLNNAIMGADITLEYTNLHIHALPLPPSTPMADEFLSSSTFNAVSGTISLQDKEIQEFRFGVMNSGSRTLWSLDHDISKGTIDTIRVAAGSSGVIRIQDIGPILLPPGDRSITLQVLFRENPDDNIVLELVSENFPVVPIDMRAYMNSEGIIEMYNDSFVGTRGVALNDTKDSIVLGVISHDKTLRYINTLATPPDVVRRYLFRAPADNTQTVVVNENVNLSYSEDQSTFMGTGSGIFEVRGWNPENPSQSVIDLTHSSGRPLSGFALHNDGSQIGIFDLTISGGKTALELANPSATAHVDNVIFRNNGYAIANLQGSVRILNTLFFDNFVGAIYNARAGLIADVSVSAFRGNYTDGDGAAIYNDGTISAITGSNFTGNYSGTSGGAIYNSNTISQITGSTFTSNYSGNYGYLGGAIDNEGLVEGIVKSTFVGNYASCGGAIGNRGQILNLVAVFEMNSVDIYGGAIDNEGSIETINSTFTGNYVGRSSSYGGGAIYNSGAIGTIADTSFTDNYAVNSSAGAVYNARTITEIIDTTFTGNYAGRTGGAIYNLGSISTISDSEFNGNYTDGNGGAISNLRTISAITGSTFTGNYADFGGAIFNNGTIYSVTGTFTSNYAGTSGGAIYNGSVIETINSTFTGNYSDYGGAIYLYKAASIKNIDADFVGNYSAYGGAIYYRESSYSNEVYGSFRGNHAIVGGAIFLSGMGENGPQIQTLRANFTGNYADFGGAITFDEGASIVIIRDSRFIGNYSTNYGGAILIGNAVSSGILETYFENNYSGTGGAISITSNSAIAGIGKDLTGDFVRNHADNYGGAIAITGAANPDGTFAASMDAQIGRSISGSFTGNWAGNLGGAIYNLGSIGSIQALFDSNYVLNPESQGGAIYNENSIETINSTFTGNYAEAGGAIFSSGYIGRIETSTFTGNYAIMDGGAILNMGNIEDGFINSTFENNSAGNFGGAIANTGGNIGAIQASTFTGNYAGVSGGALFLNVTEFHIVDTSFTDNYVLDARNGRGGAIYSMCREVVFETLREGQEILFSGNYVGTPDNDQAIWMDAPGSNLGFVLNNGGFVTLNDYIDGNDYNVHIVGGGKFYLNSYIHNATVNLGDGRLVLSSTVTNPLAKSVFNTYLGTVEAQDSVISDYVFGVVNSSRDVLWNLDAFVDLDTKQGYIDNFTVASGSTGVILINDIGRFDIPTDNSSIELKVLYRENESDNIVLELSEHLKNSQVVDYTSYLNADTGVYEFYNDSFIGEKGVNLNDTKDTIVLGVLFRDSTLRYVNTLDLPDQTRIYKFRTPSNLGEIVTVKEGVDLYVDLNGSRVYTGAGNFIVEGYSNNPELSVIDMSDADGNKLVGFYSGNRPANITLKNLKMINSSGALIISNVSQAALENVIFEDNSYTIQNYGIISGITNSKFINNHSAIANVDTINTISNVLFEGNYSIEGRSDSVGGAISNSSEIGDITANFVSNYAMSAPDSSVNALGGAIRNAGTIGNISGNFEYNYAISESTDPASNALGGAIFNDGSITSITGEFTGNYVLAGNYADGAAIFVNANSSIGTITANFKNNYAISGNEILGGIIANEGTIESITGDFENNYAEATNSVFGGVLSNLNSATSVKGNFSGNYAKSVNGYSAGGVITNGSSIIITDSSFSNNYAYSERGLTYGGVVYNTSSMTVIDSTFSGNYAHSSGHAYGGAIANVGALTIQNGSFDNNYAHSINGNVFGGAIFTQNELTVSNASFLNNYAISDSATAYGAAIAGIGSVKLIADNYQSEFSGNYTKSAGVVDNNAIYMSSSSSLLTFEMLNGGAFVMNNSIDGAKGYDVVIGGSSDGVFYLNNDLKNADVKLDNVTLVMHNDFDALANSYFATSSGVIDLQDSAYNAYTFGVLNGMGDTLWKLDHVLDFANVSGSIDTITVAEGSTGVIKIDNIGNVVLPSDDSSIVLKVLNRLNPDDTIVLELTENLSDKYQVTSSSYLVDGAYQFYSNSFVGDKGVSLNDTKDSIVIGVLYRDSTLRYVNTLSTADDVTRTYTFATPATQGEVVTVKENVNLSYNREGTEKIGTGKGKLVDQGYDDDATHSVIDLYNEDNTVKLEGFCMNKDNLNLTLKNLTIQNSSFVLSISSSSQVATIENVIFKDNERVYAGSGKIEKISNSRFENNHSELNAPVITNGNIISLIENTSFVNNSSGDSGGAIQTSGTIEQLSNVEFIGNYTASYGGAIFNYRSINKIVGKFIDNYSAQSAGAIFFNVASVVDSIEDSEFIGNYSLDRAGAIFNFGKITLVDNTKFKSNYAKTGGAIYNNASSSSPGTIETISNSTFEGNYADYYGGAIYNIELIGTISGSTFDGNYAGKYGGAIANMGGNIGPIIDSTFTGNYAGNYGGAIYNTSTGAIETINSTFTGNYTGNYSGGAIANSGAIETINSTFIGNYATTSGGAIANYAGATINTLSGTFENNTANNGGAIYNGGTITTIEATFTGNKSDFEGGAINNASNIETISNSIFRNNSSIERQAGAINNSGTIDTINDSLFENNSATLVGGAIQNVSGTIKSISATFDGNSGQSGGAIYNNYDSTIEKVSNSIFKNNFSTNGAGGAIGNVNDLLEFVDTKFIGNYAGVGGALYNSSYQTKNGYIRSISNTEFTGNYATSNGGGIYNYNNAKIDTIVADFSGNYAGITGGAIFNYNAKIDTIVADFTGNYAGTSGGAVYTTNALTFTNTNFTDNYVTSASGFGGAIWSSADLTFNADAQQVEFTGNYVGSADNKQAIWVDNASAILRFNILNNGSFLFNDYIVGTSGYTVNIVGAGLFTLNGAIKNANVSLNDATLEISSSPNALATSNIIAHSGVINLQNDTVNDFVFGVTQSKSVALWKLDSTFDFTNNTGTIDTISVAAGSEGTITIDSIGTAPVVPDGYEDTIVLKVLNRADENDAIYLALSQNITTQNAVDASQYLVGSNYE
ncbi:hypothetical protein IKJ53_04050, partial [bacterium]|nr:hypothetical protein [bacterium]